jgi:hypothetical protein
MTGPSRLLYHCLYILLVAAGLIYLVEGQQDYSCSPERPCKLGCCGKNNVSRLPALITYHAGALLNTYTGMRHGPFILRPRELHVRL